MSAKKKEPTLHKGVCKSFNTEAKVAEDTQELCLRCHTPFDQNHECPRAKDLVRKKPKGFLNTYALIVRE